MAFVLKWRIVRRTDVDTGAKVVAEGEQTFATFAALRTFMRNKIDEANLADLYKVNLMVVIT